MTKYEIFKLMKYKLSSTKYHHFVNYTRVNSIRNLILIKTSTLIVFCLIFKNYASQAQKANKPIIELTGSMNFALNEGYPLWGLGSHLKMLWAVDNRNSALTGMIGVDRLYEDIIFDGYNYTFATTSIGFRKSIQSVFIEPKAGIGISYESNETDFCGFIGIEPGIQKKHFSFSIDYRFISSDGLIYGDYFHTFAFRVGYRFLKER